MSIDILAIEKTAAIVKIATTDKTVAVGLYVHQLSKVDFHIVIDRPNSIAVVLTHTPVSKLERYLIFIVVVGVVAAQTYEEYQVAIVDGIRLSFLFCMYKHLDFTIVAQIIGCTTINSAGIARSQVGDVERESLLVELGRG